ncbi:MAG: metallophosphatase domain-containing protein [Pyrinomonadaceae bacterium]|nr:metallophosphatase domain-containing protein [Pyrinomonadaceae bacterium]MCX7639224.1 metallophosphatase domain-containing protein [Pyrinomonadaceae bacterium]MDW8303554.1 metallophosphatase domain-containing protein [Acidobacteriota bacterium]
MLIVCISDTHNQRIDPPEGDILIHAGDATNEGTSEELKEFFDWFCSLPHKTKIFVAGNHDVLFEKDPETAKSFISDSTIYLQDTSVKINGIKIYGSPWQPVFFDWAFCLPRGKKLAEKWELIPDDVEILVTHCPPYGILDEVYKNGGTSHEGCEELRKRVEVLSRKRLKLHVFGHIHSGYGITKAFGVEFVNACICDEENIAKQKPIVIEI